MNLNKSYLPRYKLKGFDNYYVTDQGEVYNIKTDNFVKCYNDKGWHYYLLKDKNNITSKINLDKFNSIQQPYYEDNKVNRLCNQASKVVLTEKEEEFANLLNSF